MYVISSTRALNTMLGVYGSVLVPENSEVTGSFSMLHVIADNTVLASWVSSSTSLVTGSISSVTLPARTVLYGDFTQFRVASGSVMAYGASTPDSHTV
jgi:hypothetical protein